MKNLIALIIFSVLFSGCGMLSGINYKYPKSWPELSTQSNLCSNIDGEYSNLGDFIHAPKGGSPFLAFHFGFNMGTVGELESIKSVKIVCANNQLHLSAFNENGNLFKKVISLNSNEFKVEKNTLQFPKIDTSTAEALGGYFGNSDFQISIARDGSLIGQETSTIAGLAMWLIPMQDKQIFWYHWKKL